MFEPRFYKNVNNDLMLDVPMRYPGDGVSGRI